MKFSIGICLLAILIMTFTPAIRASGVDEQIAQKKKQIHDLKLLEEGAQHVYNHIQTGNLEEKHRMEGGAIVVAIRIQRIRNQILQLEKEIKLLESIDWNSVQEGLDRIGNDAAQSGANGWGAYDSQTQCQLGDGSVQRASNTFDANSSAARRNQTSALGSFSGIPAVVPGKVTALPQTGQRKTPARAYTGTGTGAFVSADYNGPRQSVQSPPIRTTGSPGVAR